MQMKKSMIRNNTFKKATIIGMTLAFCIAAWGLSTSADILSFDTVDNISNNINEKTYLSTQGLGALFLFLGLWL